MIELKNLSQKLLNEDSLALICHIRPDGDTLGSAVALKYALNKLGKKAEVISLDPVPERFFFLDEFKNIKNSFEESYSAYVFIDCADFTRAGEVEDVVSKDASYNIDHHISNTRFAKINYIKDVASNCENVYNLIKEMGVEIDGVLANLLMVGIITDTAIFRHKNTTPETLRIASELLSLGADLNSIQYHLMYKQSKERAKLFALVMEKIRYFYDNRLAIATITKSQISLSGAKEDETEGFIDFLMGIDGVEVGICILEMEEYKYKISLRSKKTDVNAIAGVFGGGGHTLAAGCRIAGEYEEVVDKLQFATFKYLED